jgi:hypothetical protein
MRSFAKTSLTPAALAVFGLYAGPGRADAPTAAIDRYLAHAEAIVDSLRQGNPDSAAIDASITTMLDEAQPVVTAYGELHTQCVQQLNQLLELYPQIETWTAQEIRRNIEAGQALPAAEGCYPARDVVAHPAIVRTFARAGIDATQHTRLLREMNEAVEHMEEIAAELGAE